MSLPPGRLPFSAPGYQQVPEEQVTAWGLGSDWGTVRALSFPSSMFYRPAQTAVGEKLRFLIRAAESHTHRSTDLGGVGATTFGEDPPEAQSGTTQVEQSDEHLVLLHRGKGNKGGGAVPARQQRVLGFTTPTPRCEHPLHVGTERARPCLRPPLKPLHS